MSSDLSSGTEPHPLNQARAARHLSVPDTEPVIGVRPPREATLSLPAAPSASRDARRWTEVVLHRLGVHSHVARDDAGLVVSELVSNAVQHGAPPIVVTLSEAALDLVVSVTDSGPPPYAFDGQPYDPTASHGRGLAVVAELTRTWGVRADQPGPGKTVWCVLGDALTEQDR